MTTKPAPDPLAGSVRSDGSLHHSGWYYLDWTVGDAGATLDGEFTAADLRAIADHMERQSVAIAGKRG